MQSPVLMRPARGCDAIDFGFRRICKVSGLLCILNEKQPISANLPVLAGFTYLGQFIDHDLTLDRTSVGIGENVTPQF